MKALVFKSPWEMVVEDREVPVPEPGEALIQVIATGVCGSDLHGYTGHTGRRHAGQVMGHETVGRIAALGDQSQGRTVGQVVVINPAMSCGVCSACMVQEEQRCESLRVIGVFPEHSAAFAEYFVAPIQNLIPLPEGTPEHLGALVEPLAVGWHAVRRARMESEDLVVVLGGGPIGQAIALAAMRAGLTKIIVSENFSSRRALLERLGVRSVPAEELASAVQAIAPSSVTVLDAVGSSESVAQGLSLSGRGGRLVLIGMSEPQLQVPAYEVSVNEREIMGTFCYSKEDFRSTVDWLAANVDTAKLLVDAVEPLASGPNVFHELASHQRDVSKILLAP
jgi:threonine dehydrogenase-like Zn-dependent dehydrogenase